jgi:hypothetical protein
MFEKEVRQFLDDLASLPSVNEKIVVYCSLALKEIMLEVEEEKKEREKDVMLYIQVRFAIYSCNTCMNVLTFIYKIYPLFAVRIYYSDLYYF